MQLLARQINLRVLFYVIELIVLQLLTMDHAETLTVLLRIGKLFPPSFIHWNLCTAE